MERLQLPLVDRARARAARHRHPYRCDGPGWRRAVVRADRHARGPVLALRCTQFPPDAVSLPVQRRPACGGHLLPAGLAPASGRNALPAVLPGCGCIFPAHAPVSGRPGPLADSGGLVQLAGVQQHRLADPGLLPVHLPLSGPALPAPGDSAVRLGRVPGHQHAAVVVAHACGVPLPAVPVAAGGVESRGVDCGVAGRLAGRIARGVDIFGLECDEHADRPA
ncbi:hypothetical protein D3C71_1576360 [compost metagenome]